MDPILKDIEESNVTSSNIGYLAYLDAMDRSQKALEDFPHFFDEAHLSRVSQIVSICNQFFPVKKDIYVNHRTGHNKPFSVVKVDQPLFPKISLSRKSQEFRKPIEALGGTFKKVTKGSNGILIHVK